MDIQSLIPPLSDDEFEALKEDIAKHGVIVPVVIDQHGAIVDGHHRVRACKELGIEDYPVIVRAYPDEDNRTEDMLKAEPSAATHRQTAVERTDTDAVSRPALEPEAYCEGSRHIEANRFQCS